VTPFLPREQPALGVSSLAAVLAQRGIETQVVYLNLAYLRICGLALYDVIAHSFSPTLFGEIMFARALWGDSAPSWRSYFGALQHSRADRRHGVHASLSVFPDEETEETFWREAPRIIEPMYERGPDVVAVWAEEILSNRPRVVGFSTTFQQNIASLALARELRKRIGPKDLTILFGGANCEGAMGQALARNFTFADHVVTGEGERVVASLVPQLAGVGAADPFPIVLDRVIAGEPVHDMDSLPLPDFEAYFEAYRYNAFQWPYQLAFETSRGCWWGAKSHCKFCGLNGSSMTYRSKSPSRAVDQILALEQRYGRQRLMMADNILDTRYLSTVIPQLRGAALELELFYEVKSNLTKPSLAAMRAAGVTWIQPGIESLSNPTLRLIGKGTTAIQNIQLLRWCVELGVRPFWNILYGFPGEDPSEFELIAQLIPRLFHLTVPSTVLPFRMDRFSPYFNEPERHGLTNVRPYWAYRFAYPGLSENDLADIAYFFEFDYEDGRDPGAEAEPLINACAAWHIGNTKGAALRLLGSPGQRCVYDTRSGGMEITPLTKGESRLLDATDSAVSTARLLAAQPDLAEALADCRRRQWLYEENGRVVRLVTIASDGSPTCQ
jgi:ribosomal peptide maturation radical SAM protein 1